MSTQRHLGFFAFTVGPGVYGGALSANWLFSDAPGTGLSFFRDCGNGDINVTVEVFHIVAGATQISLLTDTSVSRLVRLRYFADAARLAGHTLHRFDGLVFGCFGSVTDTGTDIVYDKVPGQPGRWIPACVFDELAPQNMIFHEVGHVLGFQHPFWLADGQNAFGEYADPYCIMGFSDVTAASFPATMDPASGIAPTADFWKAAGPALSPATQWRYTPEFPQPPAWVRLLAADAVETTIVLRRTGASPNNWPSLIAFPASEGGWWTIEYRAAKEWDRGLDDAGATVSSSPGLVIHRISTIGQGSGLVGFPRLNAVQYVHTLPFPGIGDDDWSNADFGVRIQEAVPEGIRVRVGKTLAALVSIRVDVLQTRGLETRTPAGTEWIPLTGPECQGQSWTLDRVSVPVTATFTVRTTGFEDPRFLFSINGIALGTIATSAVVESGSTQIPGIAVWVPTGRFTETVSTRTLTIQWTKEGNRLSLDVPPDQGRVQFKVRVDAISLAGGPTQIWADTLDVVTRSVEAPPDAQASLERCVQRLAQEADQLYVDLDLRPTPPGPTDGPDWRELRGAKLLAVLRGVTTLERHNPMSAQRLKRKIASDLGVHVRQLDEISQVATGRPSQRQRRPSLRIP